MDDGILTCGYFQLARNAMLESNHRIKVGCVIANPKPIIARANKRVISHPVYARCGDDWRNSIHAEIRCLISCRNDLEGATAYIYREIRNRPAMARPCSVCLAALKERGVDTICYTTNEYPFFRRERI